MLTGGNEYPEVIPPLKSPRFMIPSATLLSLPPESTFLTPNFFQLFDIENIKEKSFLEQKVHFGSL